MRLQRSTSLVGHWKFNEKSGIIANDSSRYRNTGTLTGASHLPIWSDKGIKFDGVDDYVNAGSGFYMGNSTMTISSWIYTPTTFEYNITTDKTIFARNNADISATYNGYKLGWYKHGGVRFRAYNDPTGYDVQTSASLSAGWHHIVGVRNSSNMLLYVDGISYIGSAISDAVIIGGGTYPYPTIGAIRHFGIANPFLGSIDEVRIYNRALSAAEIKRNYEATKHNYI